MMTEPAPTVRETVRIPNVTVARLQARGQHPRDVLPEMLDRVEAGMPLDAYALSAPSGDTKTVRLAPSLIARADTLAVSPATLCHAWADLVDTGQIPAPSAPTTPDPVPVPVPTVTEARQGTAERLSRPAQRPETVAPPVKRATAAETRAQASRRAVALATLAAVTVGAASAVLSFRATAAFAVSAGVTYGTWAMLYPIALEGSMLSASVSIWSRAGNRVLSWSILAAATVLSIAANVMHVPTKIENPEGLMIDNPLLLQGRILAAVPPLAYLAAVETVAALRARTAPTAGTPRTPLAARLRAALPRKTQ